MTYDLSIFPSCYTLRVNISTYSLSWDFSTEQFWHWKWCDLQPPHQTQMHIDHSCTVALRGWGALCEHPVISNRSDKTIIVVYHPLTSYRFPNLPKTQWKTRSTSAGISCNFSCTALWPQDVFSCIFFKTIHNKVTLRSPHPSFRSANEPSLGHDDISQLLSPDVLL